MVGKRVFILIEEEDGAVMEEVLVTRMDVKVNHDMEPQFYLGRSKQHIEPVPAGRETTITFYESPRHHGHWQGDSLLDCVQRYQVDDAARRLEAKGR